LKKEAKILLEKAVNSLILSVEHFNRPWDQGRVEAVLILLDHAFEMLLKAAILHRGGRIREPQAKQTIGFDKCVRIAVSDGNIKFLSQEQALLLQSINSLRDAAHHHLVDISEQHLYLLAQAGLTLFKDLMHAVFGKNLTIRFPNRVLPLSTTPPMDLTALFAHEVEEIKRLLLPGTRRRLEATAKARALAIMEGAIQGESIQPSQADLQKIHRGIREGRSWEQIFPGVASINIVAEGHGPAIDLRITKKEGIPMQIVPEGTPGAGVVAIKRVNELDYYSLSHKDLAAKVGLSALKTSAVIWHLGLQADPESFKEIMIGKSRFQRYSKKALERLKGELKRLNLGDIWERYKNRNKKASANNERNGL
jgi:hypothetical protein